MKTISKPKKNEIAVDSTSTVTEVANVKVDLTFDQWQQVDRFCGIVKRKAMMLRMKRTPVSISSISHALFDLVLRDKELQEKVEELLVEKLRPKNNETTIKEPADFFITDVNIKLFLTIEQWLQVESTISSVITRGMKLYKRRLSLGLQVICCTLVDIFLLERELQEKVEERLLALMQPQT